MTNRQDILNCSCVLFVVRKRCYWCPTSTLTLASLIDSVQSHSPNIYTYIVHSEFLVLQGLLGLWSYCRQEKRYRCFMKQQSRHYRVLTYIDVRLKVNISLKSKIYTTRIIQKWSYSRSSICNCSFLPESIKEKYRLRRICIYNLRGW